MPLIEKSRSIGPVVRQLTPALKGSNSLALETLYHCITNSTGKVLWVGWEERGDMI